MAVRSRENRPKLVRDRSAEAGTGEGIWELLDDLREAVLVVDRGGTVVHANPAAGDLFGYAVADLVGREAASLFVPGERGAGAEDGAPVLRPGRRTAWAQRGDGSTVALELAVHDREFDVERCLIVLAHARSESVRVDASVHVDAPAAGSTEVEPRGPGSREAVKECLAAAISSARRAGQGLAAAVVDLDRFARVNTVFGDACGDELLNAVHGRLSGTVGGAHRVLRSDSDQFVVLLPDVATREDVTALVRKACAAFDEPFKVAGREVKLTASLGVSSLAEGASDPETLLRHADAAMHRVKERGGDGFQFFTGEIHAALSEDIDLECRLRAALERDEFVLHYQPKVDAETRRIVGVEALVRWEPKDGGLLSPAKFIPVAEASGLILPLGRWVLKTACAQARAWHEMGLAAVAVAVNVSGRQIKDPNFAALVRWTLEETGLEPRWLNLELTESSLMEDVDGTIAQMDALAELGVRFSVDDFGTGYSSLKYLKRFPIHLLKIDGFFIRDMIVDRKAAAMAQAIIAMAHSLGMKAVAECVESEEQCLYLRAYQCDEIQGYLVSRPVPAEAFAALLAKERQDEGAA